MGGGSSTVAEPTVSKTTVISEADSVPTQLYPDLTPSGEEQPMASAPAADSEVEYVPTAVHPDFRVGQRIRENVEDADVMFLVCAEEIPAHSQVLSAQSPVFRSMLRSAMAESRERRVTLEDVSPEALQVFLDLLYTGSTGKQQLKMHLWPVAMLADKYLVEWVQDVCGTQAVSELTAENALETLQLLHRHRAPSSAISIALGYVVEHRAKTLAGVDWRQLDTDIVLQLCPILAQL